MRIRHSILVTVILLCQFSSAVAQEALKPKASPLSIIRAKYKDSYLRITYSQPHKRGREIFGKVVPYGAVWRLGANEATELTVTRDIHVNGTLLKAGTYSLFAIPDKDRWTIIINSELGLWGAYNYNEKLDVLRFDIPVERIKNVVYEAFTMQLDQKNELAELLIFWDDVKLTIPVKFIN